MRGLTCERIQVDEIWAFVGKKQKQVMPGTIEAVWAINRPLLRSIRKPSSFQPTSWESAI
jgi:hypothetical protein